MTTIKEILSKFAPEYLQRHTERIPKKHRKVIQAIISCRSGQFGFTIYHCRDCGKHHLVNRSCGNRHCPNCQHHKSQQWLAKQMARSLPTHYFLITFTVPEELRDFNSPLTKTDPSSLTKTGPVAAAGFLKGLAAKVSGRGGQGRLLGARAGSL